MSQATKAELEAVVDRVRVQEWRRRGAAIIHAVYDENDRPVCGADTTRHKVTSAGPTLQAVEKITCLRCRRKIKGYCRMRGF